MKKSLSVLLILATLVLFTACAATSAASEKSGGSASGVSGVSASADAGESGESGAQAAKSVVVYFSRTNNTEKIAEFIVELTDSDEYEIQAKVPYTDADINYNDSNSRTSREQNDPAARPELGGEALDLSGYGVIYLGYPIWWGQAPKILYTFVETYDLSGKTVIPFCTSASSGIGTSATNLAKSAPSAQLKVGKRFSASADKSEVEAWLKTVALSGVNDENNSGSTQGGKENAMQLTMKLDGTKVSVAWEDNESVTALKELVKTSPITINASAYGGFEQVGPIGASLPRNDVQTTTSSGDIVLYSGNQMVLFYGSNSWAYTRLGKITGLSGAEIKSLLNKSGVTITLSLE